MKHLYDIILSEAQGQIYLNFAKTLEGFHREILQIKTKFYEELISRSK